MTDITANGAAGKPRDTSFFGHPKGLAILFFTEMWERFSYYGMRGLLVLYLTQHFLFSDEKSSIMYGAYTALVYVMTIIGGTLADRYLGQRKAVTFGAILLCLGHFGMAFEGSGSKEYVVTGGSEIERWGRPVGVVVAPDGALLVSDDAGDRISRAPIITVMGHVDHGKTRLLDTIRDATVREGEAGGITQHIGAYQVSVEHDGAERPITFIDTPGHEAFTAMRARGAKATDIAILVVAADDGVMPQTIEAVNHAQAAEVPIVVAVNKIDKEGADPSKIRGQLTEYGLIPEEYGGDTMFVDISAKNNVNIEQLLESVLLTADASLDLRANPDMEAQGVAIEAHLDRGRGPVATVLVQRGTLRVGDSIVAGDAYGRVRRMVDEHGEDVEEALPSRPVQVIGFTSVPGAGDNLLVVDEDRIARQIADRRNARKRNALAARARKRISLEDLDSALKETSQLNLILKGDNSGTVEALEEALLGIQVDDEVELRVIDRGVGGVTETNVNLASASDAIIIGFNVRAEGKATELANREGVEIRYYSVIYQAIDEIESALKGMLKPVYEERELGRAEIRAIFRSSKVGNIAGCLVQSGIMRRNAKARLLRDNVVVAENLTVSSLKREKDDATEVREGYECGLTLTYSDIKEGDVIETYELVEKERV